MVGVTGTINSVFLEEANPPDLQQARKAFFLGQLFAAGIVILPLAQLATRRLQVRTFVVLESVLGLGYVESKWWISKDPKQKRWGEFLSNYSRQYVWEKAPEAGMTYPSQLEWRQLRNFHSHWIAEAELSDGRVINEGKLLGFAEDPKRTLPKDYL